MKTTITYHQAMPIGVAKRILALWKCGEANFSKAIINTALKVCGDLQ